MAIEKSEEPPMHAIMKMEKMRPNGGVVFEPAESAGVQLKTKMYIDPSKSEITAPASGMEGSSFI